MRMARACVPDEGDEGDEGDKGRGLRSTKLILTTNQIQRISDRES
jgi:hypothetical protein